MEDSAQLRGKALQDGVAAALKLGKLPMTLSTTPAKLPVPLVSEVGPGGESCFSGGY